MSAARLLPCGERAILVELDGLDEVLALEAAVAELPILDAVPAARTLLVTVAEPSTLPTVRAGLRQLLRTIGPETRSERTPGPAVTIDVVYDGADLVDVARITGLSPDQVIAAHTGTPWTVAFGGFAPGFFYLTGGDPRLAVPRRSEPRTSVPAGAVGLADTFSGIYPRSSPGGWQLLGHTDANLWELTREPPALLTPGGTVQFVAVPR